MGVPTTVEEYLDGLPGDRRDEVEQLRATVRAAAPGAVESIAYQMPALRLDGRFLVSYAVFARHVSLFPASDRVRAALGEELAPYLSGKGTIRFPGGSPLPLDLVRRVVEARVTELTAPPSPG
jgi:uncharacterized protein YdhG (YjbR/CyaY superfamily)